MANNRVPINYVTPAFPSLYDPFPGRSNVAFYLYHTKDIWRFTLYWTMIFYASCHLAVAACALVMQGRNWRVCLAVPVVFAVVGGLEAVLAGSIVGGMLGSVYEAGNFRMSTWIPIIWGGVNIFVLILASFPMPGGL
ncbi:integral membrane protein [Aspergillus californicus]